MNYAGRLTLPTDMNMVEETIRLKNLLGADALRDCDGTTMPEALLGDDARNMRHTIQQEKIMTGQIKIQMKYSRNI